MATIPKLVALILAGALAGCAASSSPGGTATSPPAARVGLGAASPSASPVSVVDEANFKTPSTNITCVLTVGAVRCDIVTKVWNPPAKPASCQLAWGHGIYLDAGKANFLCAGDTVVGTATMVLPYGSSLRAGHVQCDSGVAALRCTDRTTKHGFTLAVERYTLF